MCLAPGRTWGSMDYNVEILLFSLSWEGEKLDLSVRDKKAILRAADEIIATGGRTLLAKVLKGSRDKKVLQYGLEVCPAYGYFRSNTINEILEKIDWMIDNDFLDVEYDGKLPFIVFTERGWKIQKDARVNEFLKEWDEWIAIGIDIPDMSYLKDRNRGMILLLIEKVKETRNRKYIPYLKSWQKLDYRKVREALQEAIDVIEENPPVEEEEIQKREEQLNKALVGRPPQDLQLKCYECGERFTFSINEQKFFKQKGFQHPKRCDRCRKNRKYSYEINF